MIHIYTGDGKGKTTAAVGQAVRTAGSHIPVLFVQFLKDGSSGEMEILKGIPGIQVDYVNRNYGFYKDMTEEIKKSAREAYGSLLDQNLEKVQQMETKMREGAGSIEDNEAKNEIKNEAENTMGEKTGMLLILDEIIGACRHELIDRKQLLNFLKRHSGHSQIEVILTGRDPDRELMELADYITEMKKVAHPMDVGVYARKGIEY